MEQISIDRLKHNIETTVTGLFDKHLHPFLVYHNLAHTRMVVRHAIEIAGHYTLSDDELFVLYAAAWFHDTGHLFVPPARHEEESVQIMSSFFQQEPEVPARLVAMIGYCILATKMPQSPHILIEQIVCDADLYHFGTDEFVGINKLVKQEARLRGVIVDNWDAGTLKMMQEHQYHTGYCRRLLTGKKERNMALLLKTIE